MTPQQPRESGAKSTSSAASAGATPIVRRYPKPPALPARMVLFCLKPESWPAAARYPSRFTIVPLVIAIAIAAVLMGVADGVRFKRDIEKFAGFFPALEVSSEGQIKYKEPRTDPVRYKFSRGQLVLDPANVSKIDVTKTPGTILITDRDVVMPGFGGNDNRYPLATLPTYGVALPEKGKTTTFDAASLRAIAGSFGFVFGSVVTVLQLIGDTLWAAMMLFFISPLITLVASVGERSLLLPRRAAYRMAAALLIPLLLFNAIMHTAGYPISGAFGGEVGWLIWFAAAAALAIWTGIMAKNMYGPTRRKPATPRE